MYMCICVSVSWPFNSSLYITISERCFLLTRHGFVFRKSMEWCYRARAATSATDRTGWQQLHGERFRRMVRTTVSRDLERRAPIKSRTAGPSCTNNTSWCKFVHSTRRCSRARSTPSGADRTGWKKYTEKDFIEWYGPQYRECWDLASPSYPQPQEPGTPTPKPPTPPPKSASASSPVQEGMAVLQNPPPQGGAAEHSLQVPPPSPLLSPTPTAAAARSTTSNLTLQCPACKRVLCRTDDLAFFRRTDDLAFFRRVFRCVEVHLMLKPENNVPDTFKRSADSEKGALHSWNCACGAKLGDTRPVAVKHALMTAFKSASVMLCGCHFTGKKSKWPTVYNTPPFDCIEVRDRDNYFGAPLRARCSDASSASQFARVVLQSTLRDRYYST